MSSRGGYGAYFWMSLHKTNAHQDQIGPIACCKLTVDDCPQKSCTPDLSLQRHSEYDRLVRDKHKYFHAVQLTLKQPDRAFISGSNIPGGGRGSGGGGISASLADAFSSLTAFEASFAIEALRVARGLGGIMDRMMKLDVVVRIWQ